MIKTLRRVLQVQWSSHTTNETMLRMAGTKRKLLSSIRKRKLLYMYLGHTLRREATLEKTILTGMLPGTRRRGRPRINWHTGCARWTGQSFTGLTRCASDRSAWRRLVAVSSTNPRSEDGTEAQEEAQYQRLKTSIIICRPYSKHRIGFYQLSNTE